MGADRDAALTGDGKGPRHHLGITGMQPARHIGGGDDGEHGVVVAAAIAAEALAKIGIEIDGWHCSLLDQAFIGHSGSASATAVGKIVTKVPPMYWTSTGSASTFCPSASN